MCSSLAGVDRPVQLGQPQLHTVRGEYRRQLFVLAGVERPLELAHHDRIKPPIRLGECRKKEASLRALVPRCAPGDADVEELRRDRATPGDYFVGEVALPPARRQAVLELLGGVPTVVRELEQPARGSSLARDTRTPTRTVRADPSAQQIGLLDEGGCRQHVAPPPRGEWFAACIVRQPTG